MSPWAVPQFHCSEFPTTFGIQFLITMNSGDSTAVSAEVCDDRRLCVSLGVDPDGRRHRGGVSTGLGSHLAALTSGFCERRVGRTIPHRSAATPFQRPAWAIVPSDRRRARLSERSCPVASPAPPLPLPVLPHCPCLYPCCHPLPLLPSPSAAPLSSGYRSYRPAAMSTCSLQCHTPHLSTSTSVHRGHPLFPSPFDTGSPAVSPKLHVSCRRYHRRTFVTGDCGGDAAREPRSYR